MRGSRNVELSRLKKKEERRNILAVLLLSGSVLSGCLSFEFSRFPGKQIEMRPAPLKNRYQDMKTYHTAYDSVKKQVGHSSMCCTANYVLQHCNN